MVTRAQDIVSRLREAVVSGTYEPGARLHEVELANGFGVSRTPVRAALGILAAEGLLSYRPNSGYVVRPFAAQDFLDIYEVRASLEGLCTRLVAEAGLSDAQAAPLQAAVAEGAALFGRRVPEAAMPAEWAGVNEGFHRALFAACANPHLVMAMERARTLLLPVPMRFRWHDAALARRGQDEHEEILHCVLSRQGARAEALMREHVLRAGRRLADIWQRSHDPSWARASPATLGRATGR